ncbi:MAG: VWA domain-containing protein [Pseudomonadota bacterium]|nr:VWA domain-containing protein [Pseudomonadota bacterium]
MLAKFFDNLRKTNIPVSITEYLTLLSALEKNIVDIDLDSFYYLARSCLVKDEKHFDSYDIVFSNYVEGNELELEKILESIPLEWLKNPDKLALSNEEKELVESLGGLDKLLDEFKKRLQEQTKKHQGGNKWIGTAGRSPFGNKGYNPEGIKIGDFQSGEKTALKVWDQRVYKNLDNNVELGTRNIKVALRQLRKLAREGAKDKLNLDSTITATAKNGGFLDLQLEAEKTNSVKVLLFLDIGGSMDPYVRMTEQLFSAAKSEFKYLEHFYFHNFIYESLWKDNSMRMNSRIPTTEVINTYNSNYKVFFVGDATMSPYEIGSVGGSVEHWNEEAGLTWISRVLNTFPKAVWLNPQPKQFWNSIQSISIIKEIFAERMFPLTTDGISNAVNLLRK